MMADHQKIPARQAGFTLIELIAVLVLVGFMAVMAGWGLVATVQGYLLARENTALGQKAQLALTRLTNEFRVCYDCVGSGNIGLPFTFTNVIGDRTVGLNGNTLTLGGDTLVDQVNGFNLSYDPEGRIVMQLILSHQQADTTLTFNTRVLPRNTYQ